MQYRWIALLLAVVISLFSSVSAQDKKVSLACSNETCTQFIVSFQAGAVWAATTYRMTIATEKKSDAFPDGHYAPKHIWLISDPTTTFYADDWAYIQPYDADWEVSAEVGYPVTDGIQYIKSNMVKVRR